MRGEVTNDRAIALPTAQGEIVDADGRRRGGGDDRRAPHQPQERIRARRHPQVGQQAATTLAAEGKPELRQHGQQALGLAGIWGRQGGDLLREDRARARGVVAPEAADLQPHRHRHPLPGQISAYTPVAALPPGGGHAAAGAGRRRYGQTRFYNDGVIRRRQLLDGPLGRGQRQDRGGHHRTLPRAVPQAEQLAEVRVSASKQGAARMSYRPLLVRPENAARVRKSH